MVRSRVRGVRRLGRATTPRVPTSRTNSTIDPIRKSMQNEEKYGAPVSETESAIKDLSIETGTRLSRPRVVIQAKSRNCEKE